MSEHTENIQPGAAAYAAVARVMARYYEGLYHGDVELLAEVFHPGATYATASGGELLQLNLEAYFPVVSGRASPATRGEAYSYELTSIAFAGSHTALVRMRSAMLGKHFDDFLSLIKVDGQWRIIAKVFHFELEPTAEGT
ncbi:MAG: nuclear transport factor 2 family protein [Chrysiogenetes bacterium]|nr:nuclear transport factor 2 family protein [Chrysiogenetes bacterium]